MKSFRMRMILPVLLSGLGAGLTVFAMVQLDAFESLYAFTRRHEAWELDEVLLASGAGIICASLSAVVFLLRELRRSRAEAVRLSMTVSRLEARLRAPSVARVDPPRHANSIGRP